MLDDSSVTGAFYVGLLDGLLGVIVDHSLMTSTEQTYSDSEYIFQRFLGEMYSGRYF
jgi:hypothetical protein